MGVFGNFFRSRYSGSSTVSDYVDITANKHNGNPESVKANTSAARSKAQTRKALYEWWVTKGATGAITEEAISSLTQFQQQTVYPRVSELKRDGLLVKVGVKPTKYSGKDAAVLVADVYL